MQQVSAQRRAAPRCGDGIRVQARLHRPPGVVGRGEPHQFAELRGEGYRHPDQLAGDEHTAAAVAVAAVVLTFAGRFGAAEMCVPGRGRMRVVARAIRSVFSAGRDPPLMRVMPAAPEQ